MIRKVSVVIPAIVFLSFSHANCEVKLDGTLGTLGNVQGPNYSIEAAMGKQAGTSLFHSFGKFDIDTGESATFKGPADVERIISRVTGGNPSKIDGAIRSEIQGADFYFINPFGMIFGPNASLDITGSFFATSADYLKLGENGRFDARNPENTVLTADAPEAFGFLGQKPGNMTVESKRQTGIDAETGTPVYSGLEVNGDSRMMLAGGDIKIDKGIVQTHSGSLDVASVSSAGELDIESPDVEAFESLGKIEAVNEGHIYSKGGGNIKCQAGSVEILSNSAIETSAHDGTTRAGDVTVNARDSVTVSGSGGGLCSGIGSVVKNISDAGCGNVFINATDVNISDGAIVYSYSSGSGGSGDIILDVARLRLLDGGRITASMEGGKGKSGDIDITATESVNIFGFYQDGDSMYWSSVFSEASTSENAYSGNISFKAPDVVIENMGGVSTASTNSGDSGNIVLDVARLRLLDGGWISATIDGGNGKSGDVDITATESVNISGFYQDDGYVSSSGVFSMAYDSENVFGGKISIKAPDVVIENKGQLTTSSTNAGNSGNIVLDVARLRLLDGGWINATIYGGKGKSGDVDITATESVNISGFYQDDDSDVSGVFSKAYDSENAFGGKISVKASEVVIENKGRLTTGSSNAGDSGNIILDVGRLRLLDGGWINASIYEGKGKSGDVDITATESVNISGFYKDDDSDVSGIITMAYDSENALGGNISVKTPDVIIENRGVLTTKSTNSGDSGNIIFSVARLRLIDGGWINASIDGGKGKSGDVDITATESVNISGFYKDDDSDVSGVFSKAYDSENAFGGKISVKAPEVVIENKGKLTTGSSNAGSSGNIILDVARLSLLGGGSISASIDGGKGKSGDIDITATESVNISGFYQKDNSVYLSAVGSKALDSENVTGGKISVNAPEVVIENRGILTTESTNAGDSGNIILDVARLRLLDNGNINATKKGGKGKSGDVDITATESVNISGFYKDDDSEYLSGVFSKALDSENATGGKISVNAPEVVIENRGILTTESTNAGDSGNIILDVARLRLLDGGQINASISGGNGKSGDIDITATESVNISGFYKDDDSDVSGIITMAYDSENALGGNISVKTPDVIIENRGVLTTGSSNAGSSGNIILDVARLRLLDGGWINASILGGKGKSGDIDITATEFVNIFGFYEVGDSDVSGVISIAYNSENATGGKISIKAPEVVIENRGVLTTKSTNAGDSGNIILDVARLRLLDGGLINASIEGGNGKSGDVDMTATESVNISGFYQDDDSIYYSGVFSQAYDSEKVLGGKISLRAPDVVIENKGQLTTGSTNAGNSGNIILDVARLRLLDSGQINASIEGKNGKSGDVDITATESVNISGYYSGVFSSVLNSENAFGGKISVKAPDVVIEKKGQFTTGSKNAGGSGNIILDVARLRLLDSGQINASIEGGNGKSGDVDITATESVNISGFYQDDDSIYYSGVFSSVLNSENAFGGKISVKAPDIVIENRGVLSAVSIKAGDSGNIILDVARLRLLDGGQINASIDGGNGKSGDIDITATESVNISVFYQADDSTISGVFSQASASENASGGAIHIFSPETELSNGGTISCSSLNAGPAGNISIEGDRFFNFSGSVDTSADSSGGGNIFFNINDLFFMNNNASVSTAVSGGAGSGGNIEISSPAITVLRCSSIKSSAIGGNGGNIDITTDYFIKDSDSILNASSEIGLDGKIDINSPQIDLDSGLTRFTEEYQDIARFLRNPCIERMAGKSSSLTIGNRIVRRRNPFEYFESN